MGGAQEEAGERAGRHVLSPSKAESSDGGLHRTVAATGALALALATLHSVGRQRLPPCAIPPSSPTTELDESQLKETAPSFLAFSGLTEKIHLARSFSHLTQRAPHGHFLASQPYLMQSLAAAGVLPLAPSPGLSSQLCPSAHGLQGQNIQQGPSHSTWPSGTNTGPHHPPGRCISPRPHLAGKTTRPGSEVRQEKEKQFTC